MTHFEDKEVPHPHLQIVGDRHSSRSKVLALKVHPPVIGAFPLVREMSDALLHLSELSTKETSDVVENISSIVINTEVFVLQSSTHDRKVVPAASNWSQSFSSWNSPPSSLGEVRYTRLYWEWAEDALSRYKDFLGKIKVYDAIFASLLSYNLDKNVLRAFCESWHPSTNTVCTSIGELSISLWDLRMLGGLPVHGAFFDEVIPSARELMQTNQHGKPFLPKTCGHLFSAFYHLLKGASQEVSISDWVSFWFRGPCRYDEPLQQVHKPRTNKPRSNHPPTSSVDVKDLLPTEEEEAAPFTELGVEESLREEVNLAAFLACWLCKFVLPTKKVDNIRPSIFKVASLMAHGERFSLAVPVLASIYRGLNKISASSGLGANEANFPIHYVYGWIGEYFDTHHQASHHVSGARMCRIAGERVAKHLDLPGARRLFQDLDARNLHCLALLRPKEVVISDKGQLSSSWNDYFISLRSSYLTLRHDDDLVVESYSPHRFSRQFGFCQDIPGEFMKQPYDGTLEAMVQLWDSCIRLGSSSNVGIPPRTDCPLMTRKYADWWAAGRVNPVQQNKIILKCSKPDDPLTTSKVQQPKPQDKKKSSSSNKSKVNVKDPSKPAKSSSKSTTPKGVTNSAKGTKSLPSTSKTKTTSSLPQEETCKRKDSPIPLENNNGASLVEKTLVASSIGEVAHGSGSTSSTEGDADQDHHWNRPKKKSKDQGNQSVEIVDLDNINITDDFFDEVPSSTVSLPELSAQLRLESADIFGDFIDEDGTISPTFLDISTKRQVDFLLDGDKKNVAAEVSLIESSIPGRSISPSAQGFAQVEAEVVAAHVRTPAVSASPSCPPVPAALNFEPQKAISSLKTTYASKMWSALCEWVTGFSFDSSENFLQLENGVNLLLKEIKEIKVIDTSALDEIVGTFFKRYRDYEAMRSCSSQKLTKESYQESLLGAQRRLHDANDQGRKMNEHLENLKTTLGDIEKELQALNARRKETLALISEQQEKLSKSRTSITAIENEVQAIEKNPSLSEEDTEKLSQLKEALETNRQQVLTFQPFP